MHFNRDGLVIHVQCTHMNVRILLQTFMPSTGEELEKMVVDVYVSKQQLTNFCWCNTKLIVKWLKWAPIVPVHVPKIAKNYGISLIDWMKYCLEYMLNVCAWVVNIECCYNMPCIGDVGKIDVNRVLNKFKREKKIGRGAVGGSIHDSHCFKKKTTITIINALYSILWPNSKHETTHILCASKIMMTVELILMFCVLFSDRITKIMMMTKQLHCLIRP